MSRKIHSASRKSPGRALARAENVALAAVVAAMTVVVLLQIASRLLLGQPLSWSTEVATDLLIWSAFLGFAVGVRERGHVALSILEDRLSGRTRYAIKVLQLVVFAFLLGALTYGGALMAIGEVGTESAAGIPRWIPIAAIPVGAGLGLIHVAAQAIELGRPEAEAEHQAFRPLQTAGGDH